MSTMEIAHWQPSKLSNIYSFGLRSKLQLCKKDKIIYIVKTTFRPTSKKQIGHERKWLRVTKAYFCQSFQKHI